jgi:hypothetical protein
MKNTAKWIFGFLIALVFVVVSARVLAAATDKKVRGYAGGTDEEDLKVQAELPVPPTKLDRKSIEQKALQNYAKKNGVNAPVPVLSDDPNAEE